MLEKIKIRTMFLIDGIGALVSAFMLGIVLVQFDSFFGMPVSTLNILGLLAICFAVYSFTCYFLKPGKGALFLRVIAFVNLSYCLLTFILLFYHKDLISIWGIVYFIAEIILVSTIAFIEFRVAALASNA